MSDTNVPAAGAESSGFEGLGEVDSSARKGRSPWLLVFFLLIAAAGIGSWYRWGRQTGPAALEFRTATVTRGDIVQEVTANGSLSPVKNVEVGSQVSGIISKLYVDFNSEVKEGDTIAQIDPSTYQQNLVQAEAELSNAKAALQLAEINARRAQQLFKDKLISEAEYDTTQVAYSQAQAVLKTREASVFRAKVDLSRTTITAPISGVVISRAVDEGQTVAASFNTPRLFVIANDLTQMQIEAAVSEADVGGVEEGQRVSFAVDAFPNRRFGGRVNQVRFAPITNQNVVTYTAVVGVSNPDLKLRPGMTAVAWIVTGEKKDVLRVPNAALRFRPPPGTVAEVKGATNSPAPILDASGNPIPPWRAESRPPAAGEREKWEASLSPELRERYKRAAAQMRQRFSGGGGPGAQGEGGGPRPAPRARPDGPTTATVYILDKAGKSAGNSQPLLRPVTVKAGISDGTQTEILEGLNEGDEIVVGLAPSSAAATTATSQQQPSNPFSPFGGRRR